MKILFINNILGRDSIGRSPLGILYLSSALKRSGHEVELANTADLKKILKKIAEYKPTVLMFSVRTSSQLLYNDLNSRIKSHFPHIFSIFGGPHPTFYPQIIQKEEAINALCIGEGEHAIVDFIGRLEKGGEYHLTPNFWVRRNGKIFKNKLRPLIENIDNIAFPDRDLLNGFGGVRDFPVKNFIASRGCPYNCTYCFNHVYKKIYKGLGKVVRRRSVDNIISEIKEEYQKTPFQTVQFEDDIFAIKGKWLEEFSDKYRKEIGLPFTCNVRAELIGKKEAMLLREAGCVSVWIGVEAGNEIVRKDLLKRDNSNSKTINSIRILQGEGIKIATENILGLPGTTIEEDFQTFEFNRVIHPAFANPSIFQPYPGTELGKHAFDAGEFSGDYDNIGNFYENISLNLVHKRAIKNLQRLFSFSVEFPFFAGWLRKLVNLRLGILYKVVQTFWRWYALKNRIIPVKLRFRHYMHIFWRILVY